MFAVLGSLIRLLVSPGSVREIALENLALRQQLVVFKTGLSPTSAAKDGSIVLAMALQDFEELASSPAKTTVLPELEGNRIACE